MTECGKYFNRCEKYESNFDRLKDFQIFDIPFFEYATFIATGMLLSTIINKNQVLC